MAENIDLAKTFAAIGGTAHAPATATACSPLLARPAPRPTGATRCWSSTTARICRPRDPDYQQPASGNPTTYEAMRTPTFLYVEYADGEREYYDLRTDPFELHNIAAGSRRRQLAQLHAELRALEALPRRRRVLGGDARRPLPGR